MGVLGLDDARALDDLAQFLLLHLLAFFRDVLSEPLEGRRRDEDDIRLQRRAFQTPQRLKRELKRLE